MKIKKFRAASASRVRELVRTSLGDEAIILSTRLTTDRDALARGERIEMTVAVDFDPELTDIVSDPTPASRPGSARRAAETIAAPAPDPGPSRQRPQSSQASSARAPGGWNTESFPAHVQPVSADIESNELELRLDELRRLVQQLNSNSLAPDELALEDVYRTLYAEMLANDVDGPLAVRVVKAVRRRYQASGNRLQVADAIQSTLEQLLPAASSPGQKVLALVGPTGVGKTTTAAKLAARAHLDDATVALVTCDAYRVAAVDQLRAYANALGAQFEAAHGIEELDCALNRCQSADTIILDTEGRGQRDLKPLQALFDYLNKRPGIQRHLVLSASTKPRDNSETVERFRVAKPERLIYTKVDETSSYGPILSESIRSRLPVSYLGTGQRVPEKLLVATPRKLAELAISAMG